MSHSSRGKNHPFADLVDLEISARDAGICTSELLISDKHMNPNGVAHGAVIYALADTGMGGALMSALDDEHLCSTIEIKINYFRPAISGRLKCETRVVHRGRQTAAMESEIFDDQQRLIARATGTFMIFPNAAQFNQQRARQSEK